MWKSQLFSFFNCKSIQVMFLYINIKINVFIWHWHKFCTMFLHSSKAVYLFSWVYTGFWLNTSIRVTNGAVPLQKTNKLLMHKGLANTLLCLWFLHCLQSAGGTPKLGFMHSNCLCFTWCSVPLQHHQCPASFYLATVLTVRKTNLGLMTVGVQFASEKPQSSPTSAYDSWGFQAFFFVVYLLCELALG